MKEMLQKGKGTTSRALFKKKDMAKFGNYRGISLVAYASITILKLVATRLGNYCEGQGLLPEEKSASIRPSRPTTRCS